MTVSPSRAKSSLNASHEVGTLSPYEQQALWDMEEHFWTNGTDNARPTIAANAIMDLPYPPGTFQDSQIWSYLPARTGWRSVEIAEDLSPADCPDLRQDIRGHAQGYWSARVLLPHNRNCRRNPTTDGIALRQAPGLTCISAVEPQH